jgi:hypothetical protein
MSMFKFHKLNLQGQTKAVAIQKIFEDTLKSLAEHIPPSRELSIVTTKLEEACFFAKKGMAVVTDNQMEAE